MSEFGIGHEFGRRVAVFLDETTSVYCIEEYKLFIKKLFDSAVLEVILKLKLISVGSL